MRESYVRFWAKVMALNEEKDFLSRTYWVLVAAGAAFLGTLLIWWIQQTFSLQQKTGENVAAMRAQMDGLGEQVRSMQNMINIMSETSRVIAVLEVRVDQNAKVAEKQAEELAMLRQQMLPTSIQTYKSR